ncbi:MAG: D-alanyl-lipoteichoic acid biosynthesis protein DltD [Lachnospiraceae bacterium]|jgi:D-alanine transfer protein|nr:D-alanyl-lipoteichoic acid biosynthesis protein DltD [Lachnospiraceae bacterium]
MNKKKLWKAIGPVICAMILVLVLLVSPLNYVKRYSKKELDTYAASQSLQVFLGTPIKSQAFANKKYLPIMGSSELSRFDSFHPSVIAKKYNRDYTPFLIGTAGTQSLTHYFYLNSIEKEMKNRKIVFIISPQWFIRKYDRKTKTITRDGIDKYAFYQFVSSEDICKWALSADPKLETTKVTAKRLLSFPSIDDSEFKRPILESLANGQKPGGLTKAIMDVQFQIYSGEDRFYSKFSKPIVGRKFKKKERVLPNIYNAQLLKEIAEEEGKRESRNNNFDINNTFYNLKIRPKFSKLKGAFRRTSYLTSAEYTDFQLLLNEFAKLNDDVMFVIPPVNTKWTKYTGLRKDMLQTFSKKITEQLRSQGFNNIVDYTDKGGVPYFLNDTIHIGKVGWITFDGDLQNFLNRNDKHTYKINNKKYLTKEWAIDTYGYGKKK